MPAKAPKDTLSKNIEKLRTRFGKHVDGALYRVGEQIMSDAKQHYVPVDLGPLKNSGFVDRPVHEGRKTIVRLSFGGAASAYALAIHEHPSQYSPPSWKGVIVTFSPTGTGPKYLERPLMAKVATMATDIAQDLRLGFRV
jgi:hypothetical protein